MIDDADRVRLMDMLAYSKNAVELVAMREAAVFENDWVSRFALERAMELVGEAASQVATPTRAQHPEVPWAGAISTRNRLIHGYRGLDLSIMLSTVREDFPPLIERLEQILAVSSS